MTHKLFFIAFILFLLGWPVQAQTPSDIESTPISATAIGADGTVWTVYSVGQGQVTPDDTVLISFRSSDGKDHALRLRGGQLVLEGEADAMAQGMMKIFGEMLIAEIKRQGLKVATNPAPIRSYAGKQPLTRLAKRN